MADKKRAGAPVGIGVITVFTVLLVLTLSVFSALTLTSARADLALSQRNAETVSAYYAAERAAGEAYAAFAAGAEAEWEGEFPMTDTQSLYVRLARKGDDVEILAWQTVLTAEGGADFEEEPLPLWTGGLPG